MGRKGGKVKSPQKTLAVRMNAALGGRISWRGRDKDIAKRGGWTCLLHAEGFRLISPTDIVTFHHGTRSDAERALRRVAFGLFP